MKLQVVYFHCVRTKKLRIDKESDLEERIEKKRSWDWVAWSDLTAIATPGLFWKGAGSV